MPLQKLELRPGVNRESTSYANEGGYFAGDKIRFRSGFPEKIGGWSNITASVNTFKGVSRFLWNYVTSLSQDLLAVLTNQKVYIELGGAYNDITPSAGTVTLGTNPITTVSGSKLVTVSATAHGTSVGTYVTISGATAVGGITLSGSYEVVSIPTTDSFNVVAATAASSSATGGGAAVVVTYDIDAGPSTYTQGLGFGGPPWGYGTWGSNLPVGLAMRMWSGFNYGDDFVFAEREGNIYYWTRDTISWTRAVTLEAKANSTVKTITTATFASGATTIVVADATGINTGSVIAGSGIPTGAYVTTAWDGSASLTISAATTSSGTVTAVTASYAGDHVPSETLVVTDSPVNDFTICFGANPYDPTNFDTDFDPMLVRWSDQDNPFEWVPEVTNQSGEQKLSHGSYIVGATSTRQEILVWSDTAIFSMQYLGPPFVWGFNLLDMDTSLASQNAHITVNNVTYWMGTDKFYQYSGRVETLPCSLRQFVYSDINKAQLVQIMAGSNEAFNEVWWFYPSENSLVNDRYVVYNYLERVWYYGNLNRTAFSEHTTRGYPLLSFSVQNTYLDQAINDSQTTITLLNAAAYPAAGTIIIDSEHITYTGISGNTLTGCVRGYNGTTAASHVQYSTVTFEVPNQVMYHEIGVDDVSTNTPRPIEAYIETSDFDIQDGQSFGYVWRMLPDLNFIGSTASSPSVTLTVKPRQNSGSNYTAADAPTVTRTATIPVQQYTGQVYTRVRGRQMAFRVDSTELGVAWQMGAMRIDIRPDGRR